MKKGTHTPRSNRATTRSPGGAGKSLPLVLAQLVPRLLHLLLEASLVSQDDSSPPHQAKHGTAHDTINNAVCMGRQAHRGESSNGSVQGDACYSLA